jgi:hypothetical protein
LLKEAIQGVERLEERRRKDGEMFEQVRWKLYILEKAVGEQSGTGEVRRRPRHAKLPQGPAPTVQDLQMEEVGNGGVIVTFDNAKQVVLSRALRELLAILAADAGESPDELVAWKSLDRLGELLEKRLARKFKHHTISQLLWRLRESLKAIDNGGGLIESAPELGARLRLKRKAFTAFYAE